MKASHAPVQDVELEPFFLQGSARRLFALHVKPARGVSDQAVLFCPPFAEELNRSRAAVALMARRIASLGIPVLLVDLFGTGDSDGDFGDARWSIWREDLSLAGAWLRERGARHLTLWGLRLGAMLAVDAAPALGTTCPRLLLWQPVIKGAVFVNQFLRLRLAADMLAREEGTSSADLRASLLAGRSEEIAGYELSPALFRRLDDLDLAAAPVQSLPPVQWLEVVGSPERPISLPSRKLLAQWRESGVRADEQVVVGEPFWSTPEIAVPDALIDRTDSLVRAWTGREEIPV